MDDNRQRFNGSLPIPWNGLFPHIHGSIDTVPITISFDDEGHGRKKVRASIGGYRLPVFFIDYNVRSRRFYYEGFDRTKGFVESPLFVVPNRYPMRRQPLRIYGSVAFELANAVERLYLQNEQVTQ
jgi:hypothetical protein